MKRKILIFTIVAIMIMAVLPISAVKAAKGPSDEYAFIYFENMEDWKEIFSEGEISNDVMEGVTYDKTTNTLTIDNVDTKLALSANKMGDDFKLKLVGENTLPMIMVYGDDYGGSLTIIGDGILNLDTTLLGIKSSEGEEINAISLYAENDNAILKIENTATVNIKAQSYVINIVNTPNGNKDEVIVLENGQDISKNLQKKEYTYPMQENIHTIKIVPYDGYTDDYIICTKGGKTYGMRRYGEQVSISNKELIYIEAFAKYYEDPTSSDVWEDQMFDTEADAIAAGYTLTEQEIAIDAYLEYTYGDFGDPLSQDSNGNKYVQYSYYTDGEYEERVFDISDYEVTLANGINYKVLTRNNEIDPNTLTYVEKQIKTDNFEYKVNLKELNIVAGQATNEIDNKEEEQKEEIQEENKEEKPVENKEEIPEVKVEAAEETNENEEAIEAVSQLIDSIVALDEGTIEGVSEELADKIREKVENGETILVEVVAQDVKVEEIKEDAKKVENKIASSNGKVAAYFDIGVLVKTATEELGNITGLKDKITLTVQIPKDLPEVPSGYTRVYKIIRVHDGVAEELATTVKGNKVSFESDRFSTYALTYEDTKKIENPQTGDSIYTVIALFAIAIMGVMVTVKINK